jgi:hypothetical protein
MFTIEESVLLDRMLRVLWWAIVSLAVGGACVLVFQRL